MKKLLPQIALLFLLLLPLLGRAQEIQVGGRIIDGETKRPVPFASVSLLKEDAAMLSSDSGYFNLGRLTKLEQDSLIVMHVGYLRYARAVTPRMNDLSPYARAVMPRKNDLSPIELCPIESEPIKKVFKKEGDVSFHDTSLTPKELEIIKNTEYAVLFKSKNLNNLGVISALHYHIGAINSSTVALKIHFYKADETKHIPADELLSIQAVAKGPNENSWYSLDLRRYKVLMPKEGCYISVRVSCTEGEPPMSDAFVNYVVPSGELILPLHDGKRQTVRRLAPREKWKRNGYFGTQGIKVEIDAVE